jgi:hypothetical protein
MGVHRSALFLTGFAVPGTKTTVGELMVGNFVVCLSACLPACLAVKVNFSSTHRIWKCHDLFVAADDVDQTPLAY